MCVIFYGYHAPMHDAVILLFNIHILSQCVWWYKNSHTLARWPILKFKIDLNDDVTWSRFYIFRCTTETYTKHIDAQIQNWPRDWLTVVNCEGDNIVVGISFVAHCNIKLMRTRSTWEWGAFYGYGVQGKVLYCFHKNCLSLNATSKNGIKPLSNRKQSTANA